MPSDEEMLEAGYIKVYVAIDIGANVYGSVKGDDIVDHLDADTELWVKLIKKAERALIFDLDEEAPKRYISLVDIVATMKPEDMDELPTRELVIHSSADGLPFILSGSTVTFDTELINFLEDDKYTVQWKYSEDGKKFTDIDGANDLSYEFVVDMENATYFWRVSVILEAPEKPVVTVSPESQDEPEDSEGLESLEAQESQEESEAAEEQALEEPAAMEEPTVPEEPVSSED